MCVSVSICLWLSVYVCEMVHLTKVKLANTHRVCVCECANTNNNNEKRTRSNGETLLESAQVNASQ